jgi:hypothetical protein
MRIRMWRFPEKLRRSGDRRRCESFIAGNEEADVECHTTHGTTIKSWEKPVMHSVADASAILIETNAWANKRRAGVRKRDET